MKASKVSPTSLSAQVEHFENELAQIKSNFSTVQAEEAALQLIADKMSLLVSSDDDLMIRYQANLKAFKEYQPDIYEFYKNYIPDKYIVEASDGFVNAIDVTSGEFFYKYPSYLQTKLQFDEFVQSPKIKKFNFNDQSGNEANFMHVDSLDAMLDLLPKNLNLDNQATTEPEKKLSSLMIFGVGAGYHVELFAQQYDVRCLYIVEPDLDLFFLSLFSINWQYVLSTFYKKNTLVHISLGDQKDTFFDEVMRESEINGRFQMCRVGGYIHYESTKISDILTEFNRRYLEMGQGWGFFDDAVMAIGHTLQNLEEKIPLLKKTEIHNNEFSETSVFIIGNGPSLDGLIEIIKKEQDKAIIISCGSALSALYQYGIIPDFHCEQERTFPVAEKVEHSCPTEFLDNMALLAPTTVHPAVFSMFKRAIMAPKANEPSTALLLRDPLGKTLFSAHHFINPTVANTALNMGYNLGFKNFYLFGIDLGHKQGSNHHSKKSLYYNESEQDLDLYNVDENSLIRMPGNFGGVFHCDSFFYQSNSNLSKQVIFHDDLLCFNLSDGANIPGTTPMSADLLTMKLSGQVSVNKKEIVNTVINQVGYFDENSELHSRLLQDLDYQYFDVVCQDLIALNSIPVNTFKEATTRLLDITKMLNGVTEHMYLLLVGTTMHIQVILTHILYSSDDEELGLEGFNKGLLLYCEFLEKAMLYYRKNAEQAHFIQDSQWIVKLRNK